jgi:hypothetical protein
MTCGMAWLGRFDLVASSTQRFDALAKRRIVSVGIERNRDIRCRWSTQVMLACGMGGGAGRAQQAAFFQRFDAKRRQTRLATLDPSTTSM